MGSPISGFIAEAVLQRLESLVFQHHKPKFWARYVDDTFVVIERDQVLTFKERLNSVFPDIQFTMEEEENDQLAFLDVLVWRKDCADLKAKVFRKATNTMQVLNFNSNHPISHKRCCKYYCVKGNSPNTRPRLIHKTPELAADALLMKLQNYFDQSKAYLKKSTSEFRQQMSRLELLCSRLARTFFDVLYGRLQRKCETSLQGIDAEFREQLKQFDLQREQNYSQLHPKLGFPQFLLTEFDSLQSREERRRQDTGELFISTLRRKADVLQAACRDFAKKAPLLLESLLLRFDSLVCSDEIQDGTTYEQIKGTPMGSPISGLIAEAVLQKLERRLFEEYKPKFWARYVDDTS
nr:unnamed protein product [Spirometra erinaceieuropaei]